MEVCMFKNDRKTVKLAQCAKSRALSKSVESIINIGSFKNKCVILKLIFKYK